MTIAPNGDLIVADLYEGIWVFDPSFKRKRLLWQLPQPNGQFFFDSKERLIVPTQTSLVYVFDPPYRGKPALLIGVPGDILEVAVDTHDDVFVGTEPTKQGATYECKPPAYYPCANLGFGNGAAAIDASDDLLTGTSSNELGVFPPPYKHAKVRVKMPFGFYWITAARSGDTFVAGTDGAGINHLAVFSQSLKGRPRRLPIEQYMTTPGTEYGIAGNRDLFVSEGKYEGERLCVSIYPYPYSDRSRKCIRTTYPTWSIFAQ